MTNNIIDFATHRARQKRDRRDRRVAFQHNRMALMYRRLRMLSGSGASIEHARVLIDRYTRSTFGFVPRLGFVPGLGGEAFAFFMLSLAADELDEEALDAYFMELARSQAIRAAMSK